LRYADRYRAGPDDVEDRYVPDMPIDERTFTDAEVREILKKAVERAVRQRSPGATSTDVARSEGLNLAELKAIAAEVGIDGAHLEDAARAVVQVGGNRPSRLLGGPRVLNFERTVPGEIRSADTQEIVSRIRRLMGHRARWPRSAVHWNGAPRRNPANGT
jgi:hypothetical protein